MLDRTVAAHRRARVTALVALVLVAGCGRRVGVRPDAGADAPAGAFAEAGVGGARPDAADVVVARPDTSVDRADDVVDGRAADAFALGPTFGELPDAGVGLGFCSAGAWCWSGSAVSGTGADLHGVWGSGPNDVWAVGDDTILHWNGQAWFRVPTDVEASFAGVWGSGPRDVWIVGDGSTFLHWDGTALSSVPSGVSASLTAVWGAGPSDVWAVGSGSDEVGSSVTLHFDGRTWTSIAAQAGRQLAAVWGSGSNDVWAVGVGTIIHWNGDSWSLVVPSSNAGLNLSAVWGSGPRDVWAVGFNASYHWDGSVWSNPIPILPGSSSFQDAVWGAGPGAGMVISHDDGNVLSFNGQTWDAIASVAPARVNAMWGSGPDDIWAVGDGGAIAHFAGGAWKAPMDTSGVGELVAVWGSGADDVWALGDVVAMHWNGSAWTKMELPVPPLTNGNVSQLYGVWGSGAKDVWVVGGQVNRLFATDHLDPYDVGFGPSFILHWDGSAWSPAAGFPSAADAMFVLHGVWGSGPDDVWAVGGGFTNEGPAILHWNGATWAPVASNAKTPVPLKAVWGSGPDDVWAVGGTTLANGNSVMMLHFDGHVWSDLTPASNPGGPALRGLEAVWGSGPNDVWVVGGFVINSVAEHWDGKSWTAFPIASDNSLYGVWGSGPDDVWAVGAGGVALHWTGTAWAPQDSGTHDVLYGVWGQGADDVWLVGADGAILHR